MQDLLKLSKADFLFHCQFLWVDSMTALAEFITKRCGTSIYNTELMRSINLMAGRNYPGKLSPADLPPRDILASELTDQVLWWQGQEFLRESTANWPTIEAYDLNHESQMEMV